MTTVTEMTIKATQTIKIDGREVTIPREHPWTLDTVFDYIRVNDDVLTDGETIKVEIIVTGRNI